MFRKLFCSSSTMKQTELQEITIQIEELNYWITTLIVQFYVFLTTITFVFSELPIGYSAGIADKTKTMSIKRQRDRCHQVQHEARTHWIGRSIQPFIGQIASRSYEYLQEEGATERIGYSFNALQKDYQYFIMQKGDYCKEDKGKNKCSDWLCILYRSEFWTMRK